MRLRHRRNGTPHTSLPPRTTGMPCKMGAVMKTLIGALGLAALIGGFLLGWKISERSSHPTDELSPP